MIYGLSKIRPLVWFRHNIYLIFLSASQNPKHLIQLIDNDKRKKVQKNIKKLAIGNFFLINILKILY